MGVGFGLYMYDVSHLLMSSCLRSIRSIVCLFVWIVCFCVFVCLYGYGILGG